MKCLICNDTGMDCQGDGCKDCECVKRAKAIEDFNNALNELINEGGWDE